MILHGKMLCLPVKLIKNTCKQKGSNIHLLKKKSVSRDLMYFGAIWHHICNINLNMSTYIPYLSMYYNYTVPKKEIFKIKNTCQPNDKGQTNKQTNGNKHFFLVLLLCHVLHFIALVMDFFCLHHLHILYL